MFRRNKKLKKTYDDQLRSLMMVTKKEWEQAREVEKHLNDYDQEIIVQKKIAESKHFYLYREAKIRKLGSD